MGRRFLLQALALMLTLSASPALAKTVDVEVGQTGDTFTDANVSINPGDSVHWNWDATDHSVTSGSPPGTPDGGFDSRVQSSLPASFDQTFNHPGVYHYFCRIHYLFGMVGTITVTGTDPAPTASFAASSLTPVQRASVQFDASGSSTGDGDTIDSYSWDFGDGTLPPDEHHSGDHSRLYGDGRSHGQADDHGLGLGHRFDQPAGQRPVAPRDRADRGVHPLTGGGAHRRSCPLRRLGVG